MIRTASSMVAQRLVAPADLLLLFGATGDLARRMLMPSLFGLHADGLLPADLEILGSGRNPLDQDGYRRLVAEALHSQLPDERRSPQIVESFLRRAGAAGYPLRHAAGAVRCQRYAGNVQANGKGPMNNILLTVMALLAAGLGALSMRFTAAPWTAILPDAEYGSAHR